MSNISEELYREFDVSDEWQQGDIVENLYITRILENDMIIRRSQDQNLPVARTSYVSQLAKRNKNITAPFDNRLRREYVVIPVFRTDVMIVSQTCDIAHDDFVTVAKVRAFLDSDNAKFLDNIRLGEVNNAFYLPNYPSCGKESFSTLNELTVVSKKLLDAYKSKRKRMLSPRGLRLFQFWIERFFGREAMPDNVSRIITDFCRELRKTDIWNKVAKVYYDYSTEQISLVVALNQTDDEADALVEDAKNFASASIEHSYEVTATNRLIDDIVLRDIDGFREFR